MTLEISLPANGDGRIRISQLGEVIDTIMRLPQRHDPGRYLSIDPGIIADPTVIGLGLGVMGLTEPLIRIRLAPMEPAHVAEAAAGFIGAWEPLTGVVDTCGVGLAFWSHLTKRPLPECWKPVNLSGQRLAISRLERARVKRGDRL